MAAPDDLLANYQALHDITLATLDIVRSERWPLLHASVARQTDVVAQLRASPITIDQLATDARARAERLLRETDAANRELTERVNLWKEQLSTMLKEVSSARANVRRLTRAYG